MLAAVAVGRGDRPALLVDRPTRARSRVATRGSTPPPGSTARSPRTRRSRPIPSTLPLVGRESCASSCQARGDSRRSAARSRRSFVRDGVRWLLVGGVVTDRVLRAASDYPREVAFYRSLERMRPRLLARRRSPDDATGPGSASTASRLARWNVAASRGSRDSRSATAVFLSGATLLGVEIAASRVLAPTFGSSLYVWGALIGVVLTGLSIGYWAGGALADRWPSPYLFVGAIALGCGTRARDPARRRVGARAGRLLGSRAEARPARRGDRSSSGR